MTEQEHKKLRKTHDGHGRISCETRRELHKYFDSKSVNEIMDKLSDLEDDSKNPYLHNNGQPKLFEELTFDEFQEIVNE